MKRRDFCRQATVLCCGASVLTAAPLAFMQNSASALPPQGDTKACLAVSSYPFRFFIDSPTNNRRDTSLPGMTAAQFGEFARDRFGLAAIELLEKHFAATDDSYLHELRSTLTRQRVKLVNIAFDNKAQLCSTDSAVAQAAMDLHRAWIDRAVILGCPSVRMRIPMGADPKVLDVACAISQLKPLAAYAGSRGILLSLENDSPFTESPAQLRQVVTSVRSPHLHVLPDMGNGLATGDAAANEQDMRQLFPLAYNIAHAKDWETINGVRKELSLRPLLQIAHRAGYRGWYSLESDARTDAAADTERLMHAMMDGLQAIRAESPGRTLGAARRNATRS